MQVCYSDEPFPADECKHSVFLAGPSPRDTGVTSWRIEAIQQLRELGYQGRVFVPQGRASIEGASGPEVFDYDNQVDWEKTGLRQADVILFWVPRKLPEMPGLTTNVEFGFWIATSPERVLYGRPSWAQKVSYLDLLYRERTGSFQDHEPVFDDLRKLLMAVVKRSL